MNHQTTAITLEQAIEEMDLLFGPRAFPTRVGDGWKVIRARLKQTPSGETDRDQLELGMQFAIWMRGRESWPTIHEVVDHWKMAPAFAYLMLAGYCEAAGIEAMP